MAILEIRYLGDPILRRSTRPVEAFDEELGSFVDDLLETMYAAEGVGLAAPQVGDGRRVTVIDVSEVRDGTFPSDAESFALTETRAPQRPILYSTPGAKK